MPTGTFTLKLLQLWARTLAFCRTRFTTSSTPSSEQKLIPSDLIHLLLQCKKASHKRRKYYLILWTLPYLTWSKHQNFKQHLQKQWYPALCLVLSWATVLVVHDDNLPVRTAILSLWKKEQLALWLDRNNFANRGKGANAVFSWTIFSMSLQIRKQP